MSGASDPMPVPKEWPQEVAELYDPLRILGQGGFASVVLAREKGGKKALVAIKVVGQNKDKTKLQCLTYAHREVDILRELSHPNIMKVIQSWDVANQEEQAVSGSVSPNKTVCVMALQHEKGPTLESLLQYGGALSNKFGRVVIAQAMDAVAYLHYRAVVHRDIKPDNLIVTGALSKDDDIWDNPGDGTEGGEDHVSQEEDPKWEELLKRWKVTLVDFGFARPLTPDDVKKPSLEMRRENLRASFHAQSCDIDQSARSKLDRSQRSDQGSGSISHSKSGRRSHRLMSRDDPANSSFSHRFKRQMSALGNRNFAAPEITNQVKHDDKRGVGNDKAKDVSDLTETISEYVSDYGLLVDSYSMGFTIRYCMTGVPPYMTVEEAIQSQESICSKLCGGKKKSTRRSVRYRRISELPGEVQRLIEHLTERLESNRTSIRKARRSYPWISDVLASVDEQSEEHKHSLGEISYLPLALKKKEH
jgi:serine/threonine protein kinase